MPIRLNGSTSGYSQLDAPAIAGDQLFTLPSAGGTLDRLNRAGNVIQVVGSSTTTYVTNSTSTFIDTSLTATITPTSSSSKILVLISQGGCGKETSNTHMQLQLTLSGVGRISTLDRVAGLNGVTTSNYFGNLSHCFLHSPATTSAITYKTEFASAGNNAFVAVQTPDGGFPSVSTITLMEIAA